MAVTNSQELADHIRLMSLHGLSHDAWDRFAGGGWDYKIVQPGYKYNLTDIAAAIGRHQLSRAEEMRQQREAIAEFFSESLRDVSEIALPPVNEDRLHSWHLFPIRLNLPSLSIDRNAFMEELKKKGVGSSVHWRPLHMHPLYLERLRMDRRTVSGGYEIMEPDYQPSYFFRDEPRGNGPRNPHGQ